MELFFVAVVFVLAFLSILSISSGAWVAGLAQGALPILFGCWLWVHHRREEARLRAPQLIPIPQSWLGQKLASMEEMPAGCAFKTEARRGDEVWSFSAPEEMWSQLCGYGGFALLREDEIVETIVTHLN